MSATLHLLPAGQPVAEIVYFADLLGKRAQHRTLEVTGRLSGKVRYARDKVWVQVETNEGRAYWLSQHVVLLGAIPMGDGNGGEAA